MASGATWLLITQGRPVESVATAGSRPSGRPPKVLRQVSPSRRTTNGVPELNRLPTAHSSPEERPPTPLNAYCLRLAPTVTARHAAPFQWNNAGPRNPDQAP